MAFGFVRVGDLYAEDIFTAWRTVSGIRSEKVGKAGQKRPKRVVEVILLMLRQ